jgi:hypothetical protein
MFAGIYSLQLIAAEFSVRLDSERMKRFTVEQAFIARNKRIFGP